MFLLLLIARSKLVPDFALTIHLLHLLATSLYTGGVPVYAFWWGLQVASAGLMVGLGMWSCRWRELQPITFGGGAKTPAAVDGAGTIGEQEGGSNGAGFPRSQGRGRGRDAAGVYEMFPSKR